MKSSTQVLLVITALVVCAFAAATARAADSSAPEVADPGEHILHVKAPPEIMKIYDVDRNGTLDEDERAVLHEDIASGKIEPPHRLFHHRRHLPPEILAQYDANKDGKLDDAEHAALRADVASGKLVLPHRPGRGMPVEIREQYDTNKDGRLDETERAALHADIESGKLPRPPHGRGPGSDAPAN